VERMVTYSSICCSYWVIFYDCCISEGTCSGFRRRGCRIGRGNCGLGADVGDEACRKGSCEGEELHFR
jgi:hypothetical protein